MNMPSRSVSMQLIKTGESEPELVFVNGVTNKWKSPGDGWLGPQAGVWSQLEDGLHLMDPASKDELAFCRGLVLDTCFTLEDGNSAYQFSGGEGQWQILGVF
jgi:hypothetical protein